MNPEKFPITKESNEFKTSQTEHTYTDQEKNESLMRYDDYVSQELNKALEIKQELEEFRKQRREKSETFDFQKWGELEFALKQRARNIISEAKRMDSKYDMQVERPNFNEILGEPDLDNLEQQMKKAA